MHWQGSTVESLKISVIQRSFPIPAAGQSPGSGIKFYNNLQLKDRFESISTKPLLQQSSFWSILPGVYPAVLCSMQLQIPFLNRFALKFLEITP
jgi:hypothetical protein